MELVKSWDKVALVEGLKAEGLPVAEAAAEAVLKVVLEWTEKSLAIDGGLTAAVGLPLLAVAKPMIQGVVDKIDGQPG